MDVFFGTYIVYKLQNVFNLMVSSHITYKSDREMERMLGF